MDLKNPYEIPVYDSRVVDLRYALATDRPENPSENQRRGHVDDLALRKIPTTVDEFMEMEGLEDWPEHITSEYPIEHDAKSVFGDLDQIQEFLRNAAPLQEQLASLDALEKRINGLEGLLQKYADATLTDEKRFSRIKQGIFYSNIDKLFITEVAIPEQADSQALGKTGSTWQAVGGGKSHEKKKRDVNFTDFPGFRPSELPELPGQIEAPQLLHRITGAQDFDAGFARFWKKVFLSEASIAVLHDLFWWSFMKIFKPNTQTEQDCVFDRLADSFAALFFSIHPDTRDKLLKVYPDVLAQSIYMVFHDAFPDSHRMFGPLFKEEVVRYCWELTTGTKPPPGTWRNWTLELLQGRVADGADGKQLAITANIDVGLDTPKFDFESLYRSIDALDTEVVDGEIVHVEPTETVRPKVREKKRTESSFAGPGPQFEKNVFNLKGLSPLITQFLNMKHLREANMGGRKVRRTEIKGQPTADKTFQDIIDEKKALTKSNKAQYKKLCKETAEEISRIERKRALVTKEINKLKENTAAFKQSGLDVKFVADRLMTKVDGDTRRAAGQVVTTAGEISLERDSESDETDEELDRAIELEVRWNPDDASKNILGGERMNVNTFIKDKKKASEHKKVKRQQLDLKYHFKETRKNIKMFISDSD